jgi:iron(III) transport system substrate-binding protein
MAFVSRFFIQGVLACQEACVGREAQMKTIRGRSITALLAGAVLALVLPCGAERAVAQSESILVYNAQHRNLTEDWAAGFSNETGTKVTIRNGSDSEMGNQIVQEGSASPADVFLTENSPAMVLVDTAGLFAPLPADILSQVREGFRPADGRWVGVAARTTVFAYNKNNLNQPKLTKSQLDHAYLARKGRWGATPAGANYKPNDSAQIEMKAEN